MTQRHAIYTALAAIVLGAALAFAQAPPERDGSAVVAALQKTLVDVIAAVEPSVVAVSRTPKPQVQAGPQQTIVLNDAFGDLQLLAGQPQADTVAAGVIIDPAGLVLTEFLAVREGDAHAVTLTDGTTYAAEIKAADPRSGLAVLAIQPATPRQPTGAKPPANAAFTAVRFGDADLLRKGQFVVAIGNPYAIRTDGQPTASWGIVANLARKAPPGTNFNDAPGRTQDYRTTLHHLGTLIQTDARLGWIAGGGALVNLEGELVGLTTTAATIAGHEQPAGYAIPINAIFRRIIDTLKEGREAEYGLLGVNLGMSAPIGSDPNTPRVTVQQAYPGSPGALAGLKAGDAILGIGGRRVHSVEELQLRVSSLPPEAEVSVDYLRGGNPGTARVKLAKLAVTGNKVVTNRPPAWRGIRVDYATAVDALELSEAVNSKALDPEGCVLVAEVDADSPAAMAGIRRGMFISHVAGQRVRTPAEFAESTRRLGTAGTLADIQLTQPLQPENHDDAAARSPDGQPRQP